MNMNENFMMNSLAFAVLLQDWNLHFIAYSLLVYSRCISTAEGFCFNIVGLGHLIKLVHV